MDLVPGHTDLLKLATKANINWVYYGGGEKPTDFSNFWGDVCITSIDGKNVSYIVSLFCGYMRYEIVYNTSTMCEEEWKIFSPNYQTKELRERQKQIKQIWDRDAESERNLISGSEVYAVKNRKGALDSEEALAIGHLVQQYFSGNASLYLRTSLNWNAPWCPLVNCVINGTEIPVDGAGRFYSDAAYHDWTCDEKREARGKQAVSDIQSYLNGGKGNVFIDCPDDTDWNMKVYLPGRNYCFKFHCSSDLGAWFFRNGIAIHSIDSWASTNLDIGNVRYPAYGIPKDEFEQLASKMWDLHDKQLCQQRQRSDFR